MSFILVIIAVFITLLFVIDLKVILIFDTEKSYMEMTLLWLYPLTKALVTFEAGKPVLKFFFFKTYLFKKKVKKGKGKLSWKELVKIIDPKNVRINTNYGFSNPSATGITCGAINLVSQFINIEAFYHNPDFLTESDYIYLDATANINLGTSIINLLRQTINRRNLTWIRTQT